MSLDFILHPTTNFYSCSIRTLVDVLAQIIISQKYDNYVIYFS